jgi:hypothetical protein
MKTPSAVFTLAPSIAVNKPRSTCRQRSLSRGCRYQHWCERNGCTGGENREATLEGELNSLREMWRGSIHGISFRGFSIVQRPTEAKNASSQTPISFGSVMLRYKTNFHPKELSITRRFNTVKPVVLKLWGTTPGGGGAREGLQRGAQHTFLQIKIKTALNQLEK